MYLCCGRAADCSIAPINVWVRKVRTTQSAILPNRKVSCKREQQVPQKTTAYVPLVGAGKGENVG